ncbi:MAG: HU family DNA-binding protein [Bacteroidaceae bacterium]|nr:HU family DNA-binding protein [Bacteroidaceae bacterium]
MNNKEFIALVAERLDTSIKDTTALMSAFTAELSSQLEDGSNISISGFGNFEVKKKLERVVINPSTKQRMLVPPKLVLGFKPSTVFKDKL